MAILLGGCTSSKRQALLDAAREGNIAAAKKLLARDPNLLSPSTSWKSLSPWHLAASNGDVAMVGLMVEVCEASARNPMFQKSMRRRQVLKQLDQASNDGQTPLMLACASGNAELVKLLINWGADVWQGDGVSGCCAIHYAAREGSAECIKALLSKAGLERTPEQSYVDVQDAYGMSALHYAAWFRHADAARMLLTFDAAVDSVTCASPPSIPCGAGNTALHLAAMRGSFEICQNIMLSYSQRMSADYPARGSSPADPRKLSNKSGELALTLALKHTHIGLSRLLHPMLPLSAVFNSAKLHAKVMQGLRAEDSSRFKLAAAKVQQEFLLNEIWKLEHSNTQVPRLHHHSDEVDSVTLTMGLPPLETHSSVEAGMHALPDPGLPLLGPDSAYAHTLQPDVSIAAAATRAASGAPTAASAAVAPSAASGTSSSPAVTIPVPQRPRITLRPVRQSQDHDELMLSPQDESEEIDVLLASLHHSAKRRAAQRTGSDDQNSEGLVGFQGLGAAIFGSRRSKRNKSSRYMTERTSGLFARPHVSKHSSLSSSPQDHPSTPVRWVANSATNQGSSGHTHANANAPIHAAATAKHLPLLNAITDAPVLGMHKEDEATFYPSSNGSLHARPPHHAQQPKEADLSGPSGLSGWWGGRRQGHSPQAGPSERSPSPLAALAEDPNLPTMIEVLRTDSTEDRGKLSPDRRIFSRSSQSMGTSTPLTWATHVSSTAASSNSINTSGTYCYRSGAASMSPESQSFRSGVPPQPPKHSESAPGFSMRSPKNSARAQLPVRSAISSRSMMGGAAASAAAAAPQQRLLSPPASTVRLMGQISVRAAKSASMRGKVAPSPNGLLPGSTEVSSRDDMSISTFSGGREDRSAPRSPSAFSSDMSHLDRSPSPPHRRQRDESPSPRWVPAPKADNGRFSNLKALEASEDRVESVTLAEAAAAGVRPPRPLSNEELEEQAMALARLLRLSEGVHATTWQPAGQSPPPRRISGAGNTGSTPGTSTNGLMQPLSEPHFTMSKSSKALAGLSQRGALPGHSAAILDEYSKPPAAGGAAEGAAAKQVQMAMKLMEDIQKQQQQDRTTVVCDHVCGVCLEDTAALLAVDPCQHHLCVPCAKELVQLAADKAPLCPFCRVSVGGFTMAAPSTGP